MKKEMKILSIIFLSVISIMLISQFVLAQNPVFDPIRDMFTEWQEGDLSRNIAKYLFLALLTLLIYAISKHLPFLDDTEWYINFPISLVIAFLATSYLTPEEIYVMLTAYGAMGMIMGAIIPFVIITFFSIELAKKASVGGRTIQYAIWIGFGVFLIYKLIAGWAGNLFGPLEFWLYIAILLVTLGMVVFNKQIMRKIFHAEVVAIGEGMIQEVERENMLKRTKKKEWNLTKERLRKNIK